MSKEPYKSRPRKCPVCGRMYIPAPYHIYKVLIKTNYRLVCSWSCVMKHERELERLKKEKKQRKSNEKRCSNV